MTSLDGRSAERAIDQVAHELPLRLLFAEPRAVNVRPIAVVALDEPLFRHDLEHLQRGRVGRGPLARRATSWTCRTVLAPRSHRMRRIASSASVGRGRGSTCHGTHYLRGSSYVSTKIFVVYEYHRADRTVRRVRVGRTRALTFVRRAYNHPAANRRGRPQRADRNGGTRWGSEEPRGTRYYACSTRPKGPLPSASSTRKRPTPSPTSSASPRAPRNGGTRRPARRRRRRSTTASPSTASSTAS